MCVNHTARSQSPLDDAEITAAMSTHHADHALPELHADSSELTSHCDDDAATHHALSESIHLSDPASSSSSSSSNDSTSSSDADVESEVAPQPQKKRRVANTTAGSTSRTGCVKPTHRRRPPTPAVPDLPFVLDPDVLQAPSPCDDDAPAPPAMYPDGPASLDEAFCFFDQQLKAILDYPEFTPQQKLNIEVRMLNNMEDLEWNTHYSGSGGSLRIVAFHVCIVCLGWFVRYDDD